MTIASVWHQKYVRIFVPRHPRFLPQSRYFSPVYIYLVHCPSVHKNAEAPSYLTPPPEKRHCWSPKKKMLTSIHWHTPHLPRNQIMFLWNERCFWISSFRFRSKRFPVCTPRKQFWETMFPQQCFLVRVACIACERETNQGVLFPSPRFRSSFVS